MSDPVSTIDTPIVNKGIYPKVESKKAWIMRVRTSSVLPEEGVLISSITDTVQKIGSEFESWTSRRPRGRNALSRDEEQRLMPQLIGVQPTHQEWDKKLDEYWHNIGVIVPFAGLELEIGLTYESENDPGTPINLSQYVIYRYCLVYSHVANDQASVGKSPKIRFYIWNKEEEVKSRQVTRQTKDLAYKTRMDIEGDEKKVRAVITLFNLVPSEEPTERFLTLCDLCDTQPARFIQIATDTNLLIKSFIERCITAGVLIRPLNTTLVTYENITIGHNMDEAVSYLRDASNSLTLQTLQTRLKDSKK